VGKKEDEIMRYLSERVFEPVLNSPTASAELKSGIRLTMNRMGARNAAGMIQYFWSAVIGTERSIGFAARMKQEGFDRFEEVLEDFRVKFDDAFLKAP